MSEEPNPYDSHDAQPRRRVGRMSRAALTGGIAAGLLLGGAGLAFAATSTGSSSASSHSAATTTTTTPANGPKGGPRTGGFRPGRFMFGGPGLIGPGGLGGLGPVVHGEATVRSGTGYKTVVFQIGQVTSVSSSSITVESADGYVNTYTVVPTTIVNAQAGGISSVSDKDQVSIEAIPAGAKDTASNIVDTTKLHNSRTSFGFGSSPAGPGQAGPGKGGPSSGGGTSGTGTSGAGGPQGGQLQ